MAHWCCTPATMSVKRGAGVTDVVDPVLEQYGAPLSLSPHMPPAVATTLTKCTGAEIAVSPAECPQHTASPGTVSPHAPLPADTLTRSGSSDTSTGLELHFVRTT